MPMNKGKITANILHQMAAHVSIIRAKKPFLTFFDGYFEGLEKKIYFLLNAFGHNFTYLAMI